MVETILRKTAFSGTEPKKGNGAVRTQPVPLPLTIENLEKILNQRYGKTSKKESAWLRDHADMNSYDLSVSVDRRETEEEIRAYLAARIEESPIGWPLNHEPLSHDPTQEKLNLFVYYRLGRDNFYIKFGNIQPKKKA
ncbi:hypothetical protein HYV87_02925 [Candidatus Woesearchaeota archaeon]|nr:hypothetical protein [Candidatus Woesearchaeota archaeon]